MLKMIGAVLLIICSCHAISYALVQPHVEGCLGGICFYRPLLASESELVEFYGKGEEKKTVYHDIPDAVSHTYYDPSQKVWVKFFSHWHGSFMLEDIFVTQKKLCDEKYTPTRPFAKFSTPLGITLGSTAEEVEKAYGPPLKGKVNWDRPGIDIGTDYYTYRKGKNDLLGNEFFFKDGKVYAISIHNSE